VAGVSPEHRRANSNPLAVMLGSGAARSSHVVCLFSGSDGFGADDLGRAIVGNSRTATDTLLEGAGGKNALWPTASHFGPGPIQGSLPAGTPAALAGGRPITSGGRCSTNNRMPGLYATNCATSARAMPKSSTSKTRRTTFLTKWGRLYSRLRPEVEPDPAEMDARYGADTSVLDWHKRLVSRGAGAARSTSC
jgi:hypothetical protein